MRGFDRPALKRFTSAVLFAGAAIGPAWANSAPKAAAEAMREASNLTVYEPAFFMRFRPNTAMDMVNRLPGFSFDGGSGARGFSGTGGNVLIDGERPPSRSDSLSAIISRIPASAVERVEIIRGGADGVDMQGRPVIANIVRKADAGVSGTARGWTDIGEAGDVSGGGVLQMRRQSNGQLVEGELEARSFRETKAERRRRVEPDGSVLLVGDKDLNNESDRLKLSGAWEGAAFGGKLRINGLGAVETWEHGRLEKLIIPGGQEVSRGESERIEGEVGVRYTRALSRGESLEIIAFQSYAEHEGSGIYDTPSFTSGDNTSRSTGESIIRATVAAPANGAWMFDGGLEGVFNFRDSSGARVFNGQPYRLAGDQNRVEEMRGEAFGTAKWTPVGNFSVESALRYEWSRIDAEVGTDTSEKELGFLKPRVNVSWAPQPGHQLGVQVERAVGQLDFGAYASQVDFNDQINAVGNVEIEPEKFWLFDVRYERQFGGQASLVLSYAHRRTQDVLDRTVISLPPETPENEPVYIEITRNLDSAVRDAVALDAVFELDNIGMPGGILGLGVDLVDSRITDAVTGEERRFSGQSDWSWNFSLQQTLNNGDFRWSISARDVADTHSYAPRHISDYHRGAILNANITWKPVPGWTLGAAANNLIADTSTSIRVFYDAPRNVGAPVYMEQREFDNYRKLHLSVRRDF